MKKKTNRELIEELLERIKDLEDKVKEVRWNSMSDSQKQNELNYRRI